ncbi:hypothetical protein cyc_08217 [Cyclospora cayetanensis]|uniref:Uncharacterized protein n=1 Tax=Cyclospora cayetanensis TaxID=88456 RepID=A0A1D3CXK0_9EIME|nr:hypothetical protein cyc_08217 [Cyclospora cayetanensis]
MAGNAEPVLRKNGSDVLGTSAAPVPQGLPCAKAPARIRRCSYASSGQRTLVAFAALFTVSVALLLVKKCYNALNRDNNLRGGARLRSLASGGHEYCVEDTDESSSHDSSSEHSLLDDVGRQRDLLLLQKSDAFGLSQPETAQISAALETIDTAIAAVRSAKVLVEGIEAQIEIKEKKLGNMLTEKGLVNHGVATMLAGVAALEKRMKVGLEKYEEQKKALYSLAYDQKQEKGAALLMLDALADNRKLTGRAAEGLAAAERILSPEKEVPTSIGDKQCNMLREVIPKALKTLEGWIFFLKSNEIRLLMAQERAALVNHASGAMENTAFLLHPLEILGVQGPAEAIRERLLTLDTVISEVSQKNLAVDSMLEVVQQKAIGGPLQHLIPQAEFSESLSEIDVLAKNLASSLLSLIQRIRDGSGGPRSPFGLLMDAKTHYYRLEATALSKSSDPKLYSALAQILSVFNECLKDFAELLPLAK